MEVGIMLLLQENSRKSRGLNTHECGYYESYSNGLQLY